MMRRPAPPLDSANMVHEILLRLPARDVARFRCVSKLWDSVVADPSFSGLHAEADTNRISAAASEALLVTETRDPGLPDVASFSSFSLSRPMPHRIIIPNDYSLSNVCNGLLCFALNRADAPVFICNPITGETMTLPAAPPPLEVDGGTSRYLFALGFSPSTKQHKLFRFSFSTFNYRGSKNEFEQSVCTLDGDGAGGEWRQRSYLTQCPLLHTVPPLLVDGKLYLVITGRTRPEEPRDPDGLLEVDVATEAHRTFCLPVGADEYHPCYDPLVNTFEMRGRLCLAVNIFRSEDTTIRHRKLQFWLLSSPPPDQQIQDDDSKLCWDLCYSFYVGDTYCFHQPRSAWFDDREMTLWYRDYKAMFKHDTSGRSPEPSPEADCPECDRRLELPPTPPNCHWHICGGYRPSLLSPLTLAPPPSSWDGEEKIREFVHTLLLLRRR